MTDVAAVTWPGVSFTAACPTCGHDAEWEHQRGPLLIVDGLPHQSGQYVIKCEGCHLTHGGPDGSQ